MQPGKPGGAGGLNFLFQLFRRRPRIERVDIAKRFQLIGRVGQGSMSKVWRARDTRTGQFVAIKVLDAHKTKKFEDRFIGLNKPSEGTVALSLKHPNIVRTLEFGHTLENEQYLAMEYVDGVSLSYLVDTQNEQLQKNRLRYMLELGEAVRYFHRNGWIHRDICPRNVMISQDNQVKLIDFGLVVPNQPAFQAPGNRTGTANYMAPELVKRLRTDQRIDIYSFAVTCYELYTRRFPWDAAETLDAILLKMNTPPTPITTFRKDIDPQISDTIMRGLALHPDDRWQTIGEMLNPLREAYERAAAAEARK